MKICILNGYYPWGGPGANAKAYARHFGGRHEVTFVYCAERDREFRDGNHLVVELGLPRHQTSLDTYWNRTIVSKLGALLKRLDPDVLHFQNISYRSLSLASLLFGRTYRTFWTLRDQWSQCLWGYPRPYECRGMVEHFCALCTAAPGLSLLNKVVKESVYAASGVTAIVPSRWLEAFLARSVLGRRVLYLPNGVDRAMFRRDSGPPPEIPGMLPGDPMIFWAGNLSETRKGWPELLAAWRRLRSTRPGLWLVLAGEPGPPIPAEPGLVLTGALPRERLPAFYSRATVSALPTRADNLPMTVLESMACGTPVVATPVGGVPEMIEDGENGFLVGIDDAAALERALGELIDDPALARAMGERAAETVAGKFDLEKVMVRLEAIYRGEVQ